MTGRLARLRPRVDAAVRFVSFSVDPAHDTPEVLRQYAQAHGAGESWLFVTGPPRAVHALATNGFKLAAYEVPPAEQKAGGDGPFLHSAKFVLVDQAGRVRGYYDSTAEEAVGALERDAAALLATPP
jgi:protein SCO1/2